ncbi:heptaprenylglyceryl phosphate synthase [Bacillaceae bacterium S4-13-56]
MYDVKHWKHVFKIDPNKPLDDKDLAELCESGTDAIVVGGTDGVTLDQVIQLLAEIRRYSVPCVLEISNLESITPGFDYYFIPMVMNSGEKTFVMDLHHEAIKQNRALLNWDELLVEGYCVMNEEAKVFQYTGCYLPEEDDVIAYAQLAEHVYHLPIFYMEYSGEYGDPQLIQKVKKELNHTRLCYGGGIKTPEQAVEMSQYADLIVVGNVIYEDLKAALETVAAVKQKM